MKSTTFDERILENEQVVVLDFSATWCGPCQALAPRLEQIAQDYAGRAVVAVVDVDEERELAERHGVVSVPTVLFFQGGEVVDRVTGNRPDAIRATLDGLL